MKLDFLDLKGLKIPNQILELSHNKLLFLDDFRKEVETWQEIIFFGKLIKEKLQKSGFVIVKNYDLIKFPESLRENLFLCLCLAVGNPVEHNINKRDYVWKITPRKNLGSFPTFSEHNLEASLHTDTQYRLNPEKYVSLCTIKKAKCNGGKLILLDMHDVLQTLQKTNYGKNCLFVLQNTMFPFVVPTVFRENKNKQELIFAPVISENFQLRYRFDTIKEGLKACGISEKDEKFWSLNFFQDHITYHPCLKELSVQEGEIVFLDNQRVMHGRTKFDDLNRLLLRVRIDD